MTEPIGDAETVETDLIAVTGTTNTDTPRPRLHPTRGPSVEITPGECIGRYVVLRKLGSGGMAVVYLAFDPQLDRSVAVKLMHASDPARVSEAARRLQREAQALARLSHPNVVRVYDVGTFGMKVYIAMELVDGSTLQSWLRAGTRSWREVLDVVLRAGEGLAAAHDAGLAHFDFKPSNVLLGSKERVLVADFGLAREPRQEAPASEDSSAASCCDADLSRSDQLSARLTEHGAVLGTPGYMAPEHLLGEVSDGRADQFAFCVTLWEALYGVRPFEAAEHKALTRLVLRGEPADPPTGRDVPQRIQRVLRRGLRRDPEQRFTSLRELLAALRLRPLVTQPRLWAGVGVLAIGLGATWYQLQLAALDEVQCEAGRERLGAVWVEQRTRAHQAFEASRLPYAENTWQGVASSLSSYADAWGRMHQDACEAAHVQHVQTLELLDRRMACLHRAELAFGALLEVLSAADQDVVSNALAAVGGLPPVDRCADITGLGTQVRPTQDPDVLAKIDAIERSNAKSQALRDAGRYTEARVLGHEALDAAQELDDMPTVARVASALGHTYGFLGKAVQAQQMHVRALHAAEAAGMDRQRVSCLVDLVHVYGVLKGDSSTARWYARSAHALLDRLGDLEMVRSQLLGSQGVIESFEGRTDEAIALHQRALALRELARPGQEDLALATNLVNVGGALFTRGRYEEALANYRRSHAIRVHELGDNHPVVAMSLENVGNALQALGRNEEALANMNAALQVSRRLGIIGGTIALQYNNVGVTLFGLHRFAEARAAYVEAQRTWGHDPAHPGNAIVLCNFAEIDIVEGNLAVARSRYERAQEMLAGMVGNEHPWMAIALTGVGQTAHAEGEHELAVGVLERALKIHEARPTDPQAAAETRLHLGRALLAANPAALARARSLVSGSLKPLRDSGPRASFQLALAQAWLAERSD